MMLTYVNMEMSMPDEMHLSSHLHLGNASAASVVEDLAIHSHDHMLYIYMYIYICYAVPLSIMHKTTLDIKSNLSGSIRLAVDHINHDT